MDTTQFRQFCPALVHFAPRGGIRLEEGLLTAAQILDRCADHGGRVWTRFVGEPEFKSYSADHWRSHSRFKRKAGDRGSTVEVRDPRNQERTYFLGNNYPIGDGACLGTSIHLTDNLPGDAEPSREDWFRTLNSMFWVFSEGNVNYGFTEYLRAVAPSRSLSRIRLLTAHVPQDLLEAKVRLSAINGGGSQGGFARGTATYRSLAAWNGWPPKEIGLLHGLSAEECGRLREVGALIVEDVP